MNTAQKGLTSLQVIVLIACLVMVGAFLYFKPNFLERFNLKTENVFYSWIELGPNESQIARVITSDSNCPEILIDGNSSLMNTRVAPDPQSAPVLTCETVLPTQANKVSINGTDLKLKPKSPKKILVIGDTGCRLKNNEVQSCDDPTYWPFAQVAKSAAKFNPDLIVHVGDYLYRQTECPEGDAGCKGSPYGNNFMTLDADFFTPASPLLTKAPWVFARGNHEACHRSGALWLRFMDPFAYNPECKNFYDQYLVTFDNLQFIVVDTAMADDFITDEKVVGKYKQQFDSLKDLKENVWLVTHRPLFGIKVMEQSEEGKHDITERLPEDLSQVLVKKVGGQSPSQQLVDFNRSLQESASENLLAQLDLSLAGHFHNFEMLSFSGKLPPQIIAGNSATELEAEITAPLTGLVLENTPITSASFEHAFGYLTMEENSDGSWTQIQYSPTGEKKFGCTLKNRHIQCD